MVDIIMQKICFIFTAVRFFCLYVVMNVPKRKIIGFLFILVFAGPAATGESFWNTPSGSSFSLDVKKDVIIGSLGLGVFIPGVILKPQAEEGVPTSREDINFLDRSLMFGENFRTDSLLEKAGTYGAMGLLMLPALTVYDQRGSFTALATYVVMYAEAFLLTSGTKDLLKYGISRYRPYTYEDVGDIPEEELEDSYNSFPSGHTSYAFLGATFLSTTFAREYPDHPWKIPVIAGAYTLSTAVAVSRVAAGSHFVTDVLAGAAIGSLFGWLVPVMHLNPSGEPEKKIELTAGPDSLYLKLTY